MDENNISQIQRNTEIIANRHKNTIGCRRDLNGEIIIRTDFLKKDFYCKSFNK